MATITDIVRHGLVLQGSYAQQGIVVFQFAGSTLTVRYLASASFTGGMLMYVSMSVLQLENDFRTFHAGRRPLGILLQTKIELHRRVGAE